VLLEAFELSRPSWRHPGRSRVFNRSDELTAGQEVAQHAIPWIEHVKWFDIRLQDSACQFYVAVDVREVPVGQVRFDAVGDEATGRPLQWECFD